MRIGITFDLAPSGPSPPPGDGPDDHFEEFDKPETVEAIATVLRGRGHEVTLLGDGPEFLRRVLDDPPDLVWNMAEGQGVGRCREAWVPAALEMLGIPYTGSDPLTLAATLDKDVAKRLVASEGSVRVPDGRALPPWLDEADFFVRIGPLFDSAAPLSGVAGVTLRYLGGGEPDRGSLANPCHPDAMADVRQGSAGASPSRTGESGEVCVILKPSFEGSSKGIRGRCLARSVGEAWATYRDLSNAYRQTILVETFVRGEEITVGLVGDGDSARVLGAMRVVPKRSEPEFVYSLEVKRDWRNRVDYEAPAVLTREVEARLFGDARRCYRVLGCRDLARIDFRLRDGVPYFIEANPLPGLAPVTSDLVILARGHGIEYDDLIVRIFEAALARLGLDEHFPGTSRR